MNELVAYRERVLTDVGHVARWVETRCMEPMCRVQHRYVLVSGSGGADRWATAGEALPGNEDVIEDAMCGDGQVAALLAPDFYGVPWAALSHGLVAIMLERAFTIHPVTWLAASQLGVTRWICTWPAAAGHRAVIAPALAEIVAGACADVGGQRRVVRG